MNYFMHIKSAIEDTRILDVLPQKSTWGADDHVEGIDEIGVSQITTSTFYLPSHGLRKGGQGVCPRKDMLTGTKKNAAIRLHFSL
ncbi:hypothetical protein VSP9026_02893 [Vibrio spartinae]|uniref:Uncharacterized protein n=1 Tax=Vibrio spartinae TaxID=1918945 RepID=A0A1N6M6V9_9VIBR|nr:hypothetical protein VSP9026_02893 [Vibrio spartinae]